MAEVWGWELFFDEVLGFLGNIRSSDANNQDYLEYSLERLEIVISSISAIKNSLSAGLQQQQNDHDVLQRLLNELFESLNGVYNELDERLDSVISVSVSSYRVPTVQNGQRGRPRFTITPNQLFYLASLSFSWSTIAKMLGISRMTLYRRRVEFGMARRFGTSISYDQLLFLLREMRSQYPEMGEVMVLGRLRALGFYVSRDRLRRAIRETDPINTALRRTTGPVSRRVYSVPGPNSLWHIGTFSHISPILSKNYFSPLTDGHHKSVRWGFVTHGCIDGYSRMITFLHCSTNNKASTVYDLFLKAIRTYGLPSRMRSDQGRENILVAQHMLENRGLGRGSFLTARSNHNQRIERLWRDVHRCATQLYYRLFYHLEDRDFLDPQNDVHLFALQYVYLRRINTTLEGFMEGWNNHGIRTAQSRSPNQLFVESVLRLRQSGLTALDFFEHIDEAYGVEDGIALQDDEGVEIPQSNFMLQEDHYEELQSTVDPQAPSESYGIDLYQSALSFVYDKIRSNPLIYGELA